MKKISGLIIKPDIFFYSLKLSNNEFTQIFEAIRDYNCMSCGSGLYITTEMDEIVRIFNEILDLGLKENDMTLSEIKKALSYT